MRTLRRLKWTGYKKEADNSTGTLFPFLFRYTIGHTRVRDFVRWADLGLFFIYFHLFVQKSVAVRRIRTRIVRVDGEDADHLSRVPSW